MQAAQLPKGSMERLLLVAAFAQSGFAAGLRPYKCLNPVVGETFEVSHQLFMTRTSHLLATRALATGKRLILTCSAYIDSVTAESCLDQWDDELRECQR